MSEPRWDVVVRVRDGAEQKLHGPVVHIGANPGPGGLRLSGFGLDDRHALLNAYSRQVSVSPVGSSPVRVAPHGHVDWQHIDPIPGPTPLTDGCVLLLGRLERGVAVEFVRAEAMVVTAGSLASAPTVAVTPPSRLPIVAAAVVVVGAAAVVAAAAVGLGLLLVFRPPRREPSTREEGPASGWFDTTAACAIDGEARKCPVIRLEADKREIAAQGMDAWTEQPFAAFVVEPNAERAHDKGLLPRDAWDAALFERTAAATRVLGRRTNTWKKLDQVRTQYAAVLVALRAAHLPDALAAIPYADSQFDSDKVSDVCAAGAWQLPPEIGSRLPAQIAVKGCTLSNPTMAGWEPTSPLPPLGVVSNADYVDRVDPSRPACRITKCDQDDRTALRAATGAAAVVLGEAWNDPEIAASGSAVQLTIASWEAGYDDARLVPPGRPTNILPALRSRKPTAHLFGDNLRCDETQVGDQTCGGAFTADTQHYVAPILAIHFLAVCYYAKNYPDDPAFRPYEHYVGEKGYCSLSDRGPGLYVPDKGMVR